MPNQRHRRARRVVKGMAADEPAPHSSRFRKKNTPKTTLREGGRREEGGRKEGGREGGREGERKEGGRQGGRK